MPACVDKSFSSSFSFILSALPHAQLTVRKQCFNCSGVRDEVHFCLFKALVLPKLMLVMRVEMATRGACLHSLHLRHYLGSPLSRNELVFRVVNVVRRFKSEALRLVRYNLEFALVFGYTGNLVLEVINLITSVFTLLLTDSTVLHLIVWVLRVLLMEDVMLAILPAGEICCVVAGLVHGSVLLQFFFDARLGALSESSIVNGLGRGGKLHLVRVDNFSLLLHVECLLVILNDGLC